MSNDSKARTLYAVDDPRFLPGNIAPTDQIDLRHAVIVQEVEACLVDQPVTGPSLAIRLSGIVRASTDTARITLLLDPASAAGIMSEIGGLAVHIGPRFVDAFLGALNLDALSEPVPQAV
ncbi:hypothetical protein ACFFMN_23875 [Planobispora siamensis]|uniref:Uncharacterized protein n=1 Tax=Planobispora siamensis TaxID=936338 RepID=A0A8J3SMN0_9ACTN|nr:hypothetical protein [Planobispora siamensis]GIH95376.1 hypothetical protein Psi01_60060 [Planobispora siamensis]